MAEMFELRITSFPPLPEITEDHLAVVGVPRADFLSGPFASVLAHGGTCQGGPAGTMGPVDSQMVERGLSLLRHIAADVEKTREIEQRRRQAGLN